MATNQQPKKDQWSSQTYSTSASFVPNLASLILTWLDPQPTDRILDIGCGDAKFTSQFLDKCREVYGVDASAQFIKEAREVYGREGSVEEGKSKVNFKVVDCTELERDKYAVEGGWDKVISNAALHWILRPPSTRHQTLRSIHRSLRQNGSFIFELGGASNVSSVTSCLIPILRSRGYSLDESRELIPWFFPDTTWMTRALEEVGFKVEKMELGYRDTKLDLRRKVKLKGEDGVEREMETGGMVGWVRLMLSGVLDQVEYDGKVGHGGREGVVNEICEAVGWATNREDGDGGEYLGYVRLRGVAVKI